MTGKDIVKIVNDYNYLWENAFDFLTATYISNNETAIADIEFIDSFRIAFSIVGEGGVIIERKIISNDDFLKYLNDKYE